MSNKPIRQLRNWQTGMLPSAEMLNEPVNAINRLVQGLAPAHQVIDSGRKRPPAIKQFRFQTMKIDYYEAKPYNGTEEEDQIYKIALPYLLRKTPFDGNDSDGNAKTRNGFTYAYSTVSGVEHVERTSTKTSDSSTEDQLITPVYVADDIIYAVNAVDGSVGVEDEDGIPLTWMDLNLDARQWAKGTLTT